MNAGIIGYGLMGQQRARSLATIPDTRLAAVHEPDREKARKAQETWGCDLAPTYKALCERKDLDFIIVAVPHFLTRDVAIAALSSGRHVLCEKPVGRNLAEADAILRTLRPNQQFAAGFNYRYYPGIVRAKKLIGEGRIGALRHIRFTLGHGGRPGYESEWKTSRELCGGGALLDPGIHVVDLIRFFAGDVDTASADFFNAFWNVDVEDNVFATLRMREGVLAQLHISITEWKSLFACDLIGTDGMIQVRGRSGFYGPQRVSLTRRWEWLQDPAQAVEDVEFPHEDTSFADELRDFVSTFHGAAAPNLGTAEDGRRALEVVQNLYAQGNWNLQPNQRAESASIFA
ncbi:MAG: Gfo/Idh/MocA family oxidoreductase [Bryobacteraceae bacterium]|nr:Gfo/Idh/MocA family oxidoreductase [Bryobacteraceae bacterium]